jgi:hypothetical protein
VRSFVAASRAAVAPSRLSAARRVSGVSTRR